MLKSVILGVALAIISATAVHAQSMVPHAMNYQGYLTDNDGTPIADADPETRQLQFRLYPHPTSSATVLWGEEQTVTVFKGRFSVILGNGNPVDAPGGPPSGPAALAEAIAATSTADLFFGVTSVGDAEYMPRQKLLSSAFALRTRVAEQVNQTSGTSVFDNVTLTTADITGNLRLSGTSNFIELGSGVAGKQTNAGRISYQGLSDGLDIVGAGTDDTNRRLTLWAEGGTHLHGPLGFEPGARQNITMGASTNGIGLQDPSVLFFRSANQFEWYRAGSFHPSAGNAGGGNRLATLSTAGMTLHNGVFTGNGSGITNINPSNLPDNYNYLGINGTGVLEFGRGVGGKQIDAGKIGYQTFHPFNTLDIVGAGAAGQRRIRLFSEGGLTVTGPATVSGALTASGGATFSGNTVAQGNFTAQSTFESTGNLRAQSNVNIEGSGSLNFTPARLGQHINLHGTNYGIGIHHFTLYQRSASNFNWYLGGSHDSSGPGIGGTTLASWSLNACTFNRPVNITQHLEVTGSANRTNSYAFYGKAASSNATLTGSRNDTRTVGIYTTQRVVGSEFNAISDARAKLLVGPTGAAADLDTLSRIEIVDYTMKDTVANGGQAHKKVIAQQLEDVFPQVVRHGSGVVPDIYQMAVANDGFISMENIADFKIKPGDTVQLLQQDQEIEVEVTAVEPSGFRVDQAIDGELFIYGRRVDDLRSVDYEGIAMLNVSATQELHRMVNTQTREIAALKAEREALQRELAAATRLASQREQRINAIEQALTATVTAEAPETAAAK